MHEGPQRTARTVAAGARAMIRGGHPAPTSNGARRARVLPSYDTRGELNAAVRRQAYLARGRARFVWESRVAVIGVPLGIAVASLAWRGGPPNRAARAARFAGALGATLAVTYLAALAEWRGMEEAEGGR